jgi:hypothetical protein
VDEKPNCQVLERIPIRRAIPGAIEKQEFEYKRLATVQFCEEELFRNASP